MVRSALILLLFSLAGCSQTSESIYTVKETAVNLGNIMYTDGEDGMYDVWYDGIELTNGHSTIRIALDGSEPDYDELYSLSAGDRVEIKTDLSLLRPNLLDAYWASDVDIETLDR
ncbi:secreted protein [Rhodopirellula europaea 6C]|uniref:Secreted protein n=1 Tax=Rhodopirellula europaea 6C TaxID=1263867 RepID=M2APX6_9BACT|nr:secreted protein [Rhodopirellula europaea 6C]